MAIEELQARLDAVPKNGHDHAPPWELVPLDVYAEEDDPQPPPQADAAESSLPFPPIDWTKLQGDPPPRRWFIPDWLGENPTLVAGAGGAGKTRLMQMVGTGLATGKTYLDEASGNPLRVLMWLCEETQDEVWRQQALINAHFGIDMSDLDLLSVVPRQGLDNTLMDITFGKPTFTPLFSELRQQANDLKIDILVLDNVAQLFGGNENDRHQTTFFVNHVSSVVQGRPFAPVLLGHVSRSQGSEYSGSGAWENAVRMRWYVGPTLPDQKPETDEAAAETDVVYLARRKANYAAKDWRRLRFVNGLLLPEQPPEGRRFDQTFRDDAAEQALLAALPKLVAIGIQPTDGKTSGDYLPKQVIEKGFASGHTKKDLAAAMNRLMGVGRLQRDVVGKYPNRSPRYGLVAK